MPTNQQPLPRQLTRCAACGADLTAPDARPTMVECESTGMPYRLCQHPCAWDLTDTDGSPYRSTSESLGDAIEAWTGGE